MQKSFSLQYKNIATYIFCWLMPYNIRQSNVWIYVMQSYYKKVKCGKI